MSTENRNHFIARRVTIGAAASLVAFVSCSTVLAATGTWTGGGADRAWSSPANWDVVPGVANGTFINTDTALFTGLLPVVGADTAVNISVDANRNIGNFTFDNVTGYNPTPDPAPTAYAVSINGPESLHLTGGGVAHVTANQTTALTLTYTLAAPMIVHGPNYTFRYDAPVTPTVNFRPQGQISSASAGGTTLIFDGTHNSSPTFPPGSSGLKQSFGQIYSQIVDGAGPVSILKTGTGVWELNPQAGAFNNFSGNITVNGGVLRIRTKFDVGANALGSAPMTENNDIIINSGGYVRFSMDGVNGTAPPYTAFPTARSVKITTGNANGGALDASLDASNGNVMTNLKNETGPALDLNFATVNSTGSTATNVTLGAGFNLTGTTANQGGVKVVLGANTPEMRWGQRMDIGSVDRVFEIGDSTATVDFQLSSVITGSGRIIKTGPGLLRFGHNGATSGVATSNGVNYLGNAFGGLEIREGSVSFNGDNNLAGVSPNVTAPPPVSITGGTLVLAGQTQTFGAFKMTKGTIDNTLSGTIAAPSFALAPTGADSFTISAVLANDASGAATLTKTGTGKALLRAINTYTGLTTVQGGALNVNNDASEPILSGGGANIIGGRIEFDYTGGSSPAAAIIPLLTAGYTTNFSTGPIKSSTATSSRGLGYSDNGVDTFTVAAALYGDANLNGIVNFDDLLALAQNYGASSKTWSQGDSNYDGSVGFDDLLKLAQNYGATLLTSGEILTDAQVAQSFEAHWALALSIVPEPTTLGLLGGLSMLSRRRSAR
jgi:autotransporter-associated beta strand protein